jgi:hypothetical protein
MNSKPSGVVRQAAARCQCQARTEETGFFWQVVKRIFQLNKELLKI